MLSLAIKAKIPIIRVRTSDLLNLPDVLEDLSPKLQVSPLIGGGFTKADINYAVDEYVPTRSTYDLLVEKQSVLILVNQGEECPFAFDAGEVPVPRDLMLDLLLQVVKTEQVEEMMPCFNGLTLKGMAEVIRLTSAKDKALTARGVAQVRASITGKMQGLAQVETSLPLYMCPKEINRWVKTNKKYFLEATDYRLVPKGILLNGDPGVGKSQGAKYIANEFGVPLYRLDLSSALGKWVGESESNFSRVLTALDQEEPAVLLIDEMEKLFGETEDQGVTARLLSQLLWWLQERKSRVLTVMTTNNMDALPKEVYRAGRIDKTITIAKLTPHEAGLLAISALGQFFKPTKNQRDEVLKALVEQSKYKTRQHVLLSHAEIVQLVLDLIKEKGWVI